MALESVAEHIAHEFHTIYGELAPHFGMTQQVASRRKWEDTPKHQQLIVVNTIREMLDRGIIEVPESISNTD